MRSCLPAWMKLLKSNIRRFPRDVFVTGAIEAAKALLEKETGLYNLTNLY